MAEPPAIRKLGLGSNGPLDSTLLFKATAAAAAERNKQQQQQQQQQQKQSSFRKVGCKLALSGCAAITAETVTFPLDLVKTRLQLHRGIAGNAAAAAATAVQQRTTISSVAHSIFQTSGFRGFYSGLPAAALRHAIYSPARLAFYELLRDAVLADEERERAEATIPDKKLVFTLGVLGACAGVCGQIVASPTDLIKVRLQAHPERYRHQHLGTIFSGIVRHEGVAGLFRGLGPNASRAAFVNAGELSLYDSSKRVFRKVLAAEDSSAVHACAALVSGFGSTLMSCPADVIKTRMMAASSSTYNGVWHCLFDLLRKEGPLSLFKGFPMAYMRLGPWQLTFWITYEQIRKQMGLEPF